MLRAEKARDALGREQADFSEAEAELDSTKSFS